ncbi:phage tail tape measure protein [Croceicoccus naphthovorans]|uniref:Phage tail tape measure protein domain-containing protein n=1 Tax=Croceicoccus naphthovorans TaxID=1348774 RepID=A0A0G3XEU9_9SPHN|nr:phage tail tape measure protein [Croceicoccus naphthovorans]AKM10035.1 hypothetical protein AB433_08690 [Croceicoccus naphthovorans]MBB3991075.1 hypothetical protein [Croceicoccus naphthovorans]
MSRGLSVFVNIGAKIGSSLPGAVRTAESQMGRIGRAAKMAAAESKMAWAGMRRDMGRFNSHVSMPAAAVSGLGARMVYEWSKVGNELQAVTQMSDSARKGIEAVARSMPGNPTENLSAALDLARTGFTPRQIMGSLGTTIKFGKSDQSVDMAESADIMTNVMKGMGLPDRTLAEISASSKRVATALSYSSAKSSTDLRLMGLSFKYAAPMAARLGIDVEELAGYFMTMADNGIKGSEAGVALRSGMVRLLKPTKSAMAILDRYNMKLDDYVHANKKATADDVVSFLGAQGIDAKGARGDIARLMADDSLSGAPLIAKISEAVAAGMDAGADAADLDKISDGVMGAMTAGVTKMDLTKFIQDGVTKGWTASDFANFFDTRQGTRLMTLWGKDAVRNINAVQAAVRVANGQGSFLDKMYATQNKGAVGSWGKIQQGFGNLIISMAESGVMDTVANGMNAVAQGMMSLSKSNPQLLKFVTYGILGAAALAPLGFALSGAAAGFRILWFALSGGLGIFLRIGSMFIGLAPAILTALTSLGAVIIQGLAAAFALLSNPVGWAIILVGVAAALIYYFRDDIAKAWPKVVTWFKNAWQGIKDWALSIDWGNIGLKIADALTFGLASKFGTAMSQLTNTVTSTGKGGRGQKPRGARRNGGPVSAGGSYLVGEDGPEVVTFGHNARVHANGSAPGGSVNATIIIQDTRDPQANVRAFDAYLRQLASGQRNFLSD